MSRGMQIIASLSSSYVWPCDCHEAILLVFMLLATSSRSELQMTSWSNWSSCSDSCNGGIMSQTRKCISSNCTQPSLQYMSCNTQDCPVFIVDTRDNQCAKQAQRWVPQYSHLTWIAKKDGRVGEICELFCVSEVKGLQITAPIKDGTPCTRDDGSKGRCLGKLCAAVGCDGVLGSDRKPDKCHRCLEYGQDQEGTDHTCKHFKNNHSISDKSQILVSFIPINSMSVKIVYNNSIDLLTTSHSHHFPNNANEFNLNGNVFMLQEDGSLFSEGPLTSVITIRLEARTSDNPSVRYEYYMLIEEKNNGSQSEDLINNNRTYSWTYTDFTPCSVTCGGGVKVSHVRCQDNDFPDKVMPDTFCKGTRKPFPIVRKCSKGDCPSRWVAGSWGVCSAQCGNGNQYRNIKCWQEKYDGSDFFVSDSKCASLLKPNSSRDCYVRPCGTHWNASDWTECSRRCGLGTQNRLVRCVSGSGQEVNEIYCDNEQKPAHIRPCDEGPCFHDWYVSQWSECSKSCGEGNRTRTIYCSNQNNIPVNESKCETVRRPPSQKSCYELTGCFSTWVSSPWSPCQGPCGEAHQTRTVNCYVFEGNEAVLSPSRCDNASRPDTKRQCPEEQCAEWTTGEWGNCSAQCGQGVMQRKVECVKEGKSSNDCDPNTRPPDSAPCEEAPCPDCVDDHRMNCQAMKISYGCTYDFIQQMCCKTCSAS